MLGVVVQQSAGKRDDRADAVIGEAVVDAAVLAAGRDESAPAQTREMVGDVRLRLTEQPDELADRALLRGDQLDHPQARAIAEDAEVLRQQIGLGGSVWKTKRRVGTCDVHAPNDITDS